MDIVMEFLKTFFVLFAELALLFLLISFVVSWLQQVVTEEKIKYILHRPRKWLTYIYGAFFGALTPFCSCSTVPILAGLLSSRAPFGPSISFLIASPLINPVMMFILWILLGWKFTVIYGITMFIFAIFIGYILDLLGFRKFVREIRVKRGNSSQNHTPKWKMAIQDAWAFFFPLLPYLVLGVLIGAAIHDFIPEDFISKFADEDNIWVIPITAIIGIPMYIRVETILPISEALIMKGMGLGAITALIVGGAGASIPEVILLNKLFRPKLVSAFVISILFVAITAGFIVSTIL